MANRNRTLGLKLKAIDRMSTTIDRVQKKFPKLTRSIKRSSKAAQIFTAQTKRMNAGLKKFGGGMKKVGTAITLGVTLPLAIAAAQGVKTFGNYQQGLRGIEKTTGLSRAEVGRLGDTFSQLSTEIPVTTLEMLELAKAGGQLGVKGSKNIEKFTITMAKLGRASDVAGEDGAKSIARILTVTGDGIGKVERFSSALVDLGNNAAAGETEILAVATRVAGQIGRFDVASDKVLGISTALKALGKNAESSGSVVGRSFDAIDQAIKKGGVSMRLLSKLSGIAVGDLEQSFKKDAADVFQKFVIGLNKVGKGGGNMIKIMGALGLQGVRINDVLGTLAKNPEVLAKNMDRATKAFAKNTALQKEFQIQTESFNSEMIILSNTFGDLLKLIGKELAPAVKFIGKIFKSIFNFLRNNPTIRTLVIVFGSLVAVFGPLLFFVGTFMTLLPVFTTLMVALGAASFPITGTVLAIAAGIAALIAVTVVVIKKWDEIKQAFATNPFLKVLTFVGFMVQAIGKLAALIAFTVVNLNNLGAIGGAFADTFGFGDSSGAGAKNKGAAQGGQGVNGQIGVTFANAPAGTNVKAKSQGPLDFNLGFAGGLQ